MEGEEVEGGELTAEGMVEVEGGRRLEELGGGGMR
jgi:hypothetical protein